MTKLNSVIGYDLIENTDLSELPIKVQANFLKECFLSHNIKLNQMVSGDNFYSCHKNMELFFLAPYSFVETLYKIYPHKEEFFLDGTNFPSVFLGLIRGIDSPHYSDFSFITDMLKSCKKMGFDFNAKTPVNADPLMNMFENSFVSKKSLYSLKKGFSKDKNIVDLALDTRQYDLAMEIMKTYNVKPSVKPELTKEDMLLYVIALLSNSQDDIETKRFDYRNSVEKIMHFFDVKDTYSMYDILINNKDASLIEFLTILIKEVKIFNNFKEYYFEYLKDPEEILFQKMQAFEDDLQYVNFKANDVEKIKSLLKIVSEKYENISSKSVKMSIIVEKNILLNKLENNNTPSKQKRL